MFQYNSIMVDFIENSTKFKLKMRIKMFASGILTNMHAYITEKLPINKPQQVHMITYMQIG